MITRQAYNKDGEKIPFAIYKDDYVIETDEIDRMAFWYYDEYPYILCGQIISRRNDGCVETKEYGNGFWFNPKFIMEYNDGLKLKEKLHELRIKRRRELLDIKNKYQTQLESLLKENDVNDIE